MTGPHVTRVKPQNPGVRLQDLAWLVRVPHAPSVRPEGTGGFSRRGNRGR
ncbi:hypothetical protein E3G68_005157 [Mycobacteroides abscessus]|nr:hypothetical protein [Mycobacteroides abscessus]